MILQVLITVVAGWMQHQQYVITYLIEENRVLKAQPGHQHLGLTDTQRWRLAALACPIGRKQLTEVASIAMPDTLFFY